MKMPLFKLVPLFLAACLVAPGAAAASGFPLKLSVISMLHTKWTAAEGAPTNISEIAQTADGWLWLGGPTGLFRFDGVRFQRAAGSQAPLAASVTGLGVLSNGNLWVAAKFGGFSVLRNGSMQHYPPGENNLPTGHIAGAVLDTKGRLWVGTRQGLMMLGADATWNDSPAGLDAPRSRIIAMLLSRNGTMYVRTQDAVWSLAKDGDRFIQRNTLVGLGELGEDPGGNVWTSDMMNPGLHLVARGSGSADPISLGSEYRIRDFLIDRAGNAWVPGMPGVIRARGNRPDSDEILDAERGLSGPVGSAVFQDREGNIWVGTGNGLDRFSEYRIRPVSLPPYPSSARPLAAHIERGMWVDRSFLADAAAVPRQYAPPSTDADVTTALHAGADGILWAGGVGGLWRVSDGKRVAVPLPGSLPDPARAVIYSLTTGRDGALWASFGPRGLYVLRAGQWIAHAGIPDLSSFAATTMVTDATGGVWLGSTNDQLVLAREGKIHRYGARDGLRVGTVLSVLPAAEGAWVGGENGLMYFNGAKFVPVTGVGDELFPGITGLVFAADGSLWLNGGNGIASITKSELARVQQNPSHPVSFQRLNYRDGLNGTAYSLTPFPSAVRSNDGVLWFSTTSGVFAFDPARLPRNQLVPPVYITALKTEGKEYPALNGLQLKQRVSALELAYTALSYSAPERMRFRYKLDGVDPAWQEAERRRSAYYTNLKPGTYRFSVAASNNDGLWNEEGATFSFEIPPSLTETYWFRGLLAAAVLLGFWLMHQLRVSHLARQAAHRLRERLAERERIARELHDTLLQAVQTLMLRFHVIALRLPAGHPDKGNMEAALDYADEVLADGRDRVQGLRMDAPPEGGILEALRRERGAMAESAGMKLDMASHGRQRALQSYCEYHLSRIAGEAVANAIRHSQASRIGVELKFSDDALALTIRDDGVGIESELISHGRVGHFGLQGMRERADKLGATLTVSRENGTVVAIVVPGAQAYCNDV